MLLIPLTGKISKSNPPFLTLGIILVNFLVFFVVQAGDKERYLQASDFYYDSGLARIEVSRYVKYLDSRKEIENRDAISRWKELDEETIRRLHAKMENDRAFMRRLKNGEILTPEVEAYGRWKNLRIAYEEILSTTTPARFGFRPAHKSLLTGFSYMFLHGGFMHLLGNMIFLWLVGSVLESDCGIRRYAAIYFLGGLLAVGLYCLFYMDSASPLIGASGAISGLMGAYAIMYGKKKIKVFYSLGFYFNYAKVSAAVLLPIWIGNEVFQWMFGGYGEIAYAAHLGGLTGGAGLGYLTKRSMGTAGINLCQQDSRQKVPQLLQEALEKTSKLELKEARRLLEQVLEIDPDNRAALLQLFNVDKMHPDDENFHKTASKLLVQLMGQRESHDALYRIYKEYRSVSKTCRLSLDLLINISLLFISDGRLREAEEIVARALQRFPQFQKLPTAIMKLARAYLRREMNEKGKRCLMIICRRYPESVESRIARGMLKEPS